MHSGAGSTSTLSVAMSIARASFTHPPGCDASDWHDSVEAS